jgi:hypothetical protein
MGTIVEIKDFKEPWAEYSLEDGTKIKMKQTVVNIVKMDNNDAAGNPVYVVQSQPLINTIFKDIN